MTYTVIPRSGSISAKKIESTDFEKFFSSDFMSDYVLSGFTLAAGAGLSVDVAAGVARLKGLYVANDGTVNVAGLTAASTNYIYITFTRDGDSKVESWAYTTNTTGTTPADSLFIGTATTDGSGVTSTNITTRYSNWYDGNRKIFGTGIDGAVTLSSPTSISTTKNYTTLTINPGVSLTSTETSEACLTLFAQTSMTINGTITMASLGATDGSSLGSGTFGYGGIGVSPTDSQAAHISVDGARGHFGNGLKNLGGAGGAGGGTGGTGGKGGLSHSSELDTSIVDIPYKIFYTRPVWYGAGGGGGGGGSVAGISNSAGGTGGYGGKGGGGIILVSPQITIGPAGQLVTTGGNGSNGSTGGSGGAGSPPGSGTPGGVGGGGGGGGGGGAGGPIIMIYETLTNNRSPAPSAYSQTGGTGGSGGSGGAGGANAPPAPGSASPGSTGSAGSTGSTGKLVQISYQSYKIA